MGILAKIEEMRERRFERKLKKIEKKNSSFLALRKDCLCSMSNGVMFPSVLFYKYIKELTRMQEEQPKIKTPAERVAEYIEKYKNTELRNCPFCYGSASLSIYLHNYDFHSGFPGGYDIYARIHCKKCSCGLDEIKLETNIHPVERDMDELIKDYAQKWNTRHDYLKKLHKACRHNFLRNKNSDLPTRIILNISYFTSYVEAEADIENIIFVAPKEYSFDAVLKIALEYFHIVLKLCGHFESINIYYSESLPEETCIPVYDIDKCEEEMKPPLHCSKGGPNCPFWNGKEPCEKCIAEPLTKSDNCPIAPGCPFWDNGLNCTMSSCILGDYVDFPGRFPNYRLLSDSEDKPNE